MFRVLLSLIFFTLIFFVSCAQVEPNGKCNPECKDWQTCEGIEDQYGIIIEQCVPKKNRCDKQSDCPYPQTCNIRTNWCQGVCNPPCEAWERCTPENKCTALENFCNEDKDCNGNNQSCNEKTHKCTYKCTPQCSSWEICTENNKCKTNTDDGYCSDNSNCRDGKTCNENHKCEYDLCNDKCKEWQECNSQGECKAKQGRCDDNNDCPRNALEIYTCNQEEHTCRKELGNCNPLCEIWQTCNRNNECVTAEGYCNKNADCPNGEKCTVEHKCVPIIENNCSNDEDCNNWEYCYYGRCILKEDRCDLSEDCPGKICDFRTHRCEDICNTDTTCEYWENCTPNGNSCETRDDYCSNDNDCQEGICNPYTHKCIDNCTDNCTPWGECQQNSDCGEGKRCNENHECVNEIPNGCTPGNDEDECLDWQECSILTNQCVHKDDYCDSYMDCNGQECDRETHKCKPQECNNTCEYWEECKDGECVTNEENGFCENNSDCREGKECTQNHTCEKKCIPECEVYEICDNGTCKVNPHLCQDDNDCKDGKKCNQSTHICEEQCPEPCDEWEICSEYNGEKKCILAPGRCSDEDYGEYNVENYGCGYSEGNRDIHCNLQEHICVIEYGNCTQECEEWEYCSADNVCKPIHNRCNKRSDCPEGKVCDPTEHKCIDEENITACQTDADCKLWEHCSPTENICILNINACYNNGDCPNDRTCNTDTHECVKHEKECFIECEDWQTCQNGECLPDENQFRCNMSDYCGPYSLCSSNTHRCENLSQNCQECKPWEVCLESGCSLIYGTCNNDLDCDYNKQCNTTTHTCEYKQCFRSRDCDYVTRDIEHSDLCKKEENEETGYCLANLINDIRAFHGYDKSSSTPIEHKGYVFGYVTAINKNENDKSLGFYVYQDLMKNYNDGRHCGCQFNEQGEPTDCLVHSETDIKNCPLEKYLYNTVYVVVPKSDFDKLKNIGIGDKVSGLVNYLNYYGMTMGIAAKDSFNPANTPCNEETDHYPCVVDGQETYCSVCEDNQYCDLDSGICRESDPFVPYVYNVASRQIIKNKMNEAEGFESSIINVVKDKPYTVIENASSSNHHRTTLKNAYDEEFYIDQELYSYTLDRGTGQCISNECRKENWVPCNKYCKYGFKLIQEDSNRNGIGDTCENIDDDDNDGKKNGSDNCRFNYNPDQKDTDDDGIGDPCDNDYDGDGIDNAEDNCPTVYNPNQAHKKPCDPSLIPEHASFEGDGMETIALNAQKIWETVKACVWSCDAGYKGVNCNECEDGYHEEDGNCVADDKNIKTNKKNKTTKYHYRRGTWGIACDYSGDSDWDGVKDSGDNCPWTFNPYQGDADRDRVGDACDEDMDGDGFFNYEDNCMNIYNPILCKTCECLKENEVDHQYDCNNDNDCQNINVRGHDIGAGKCHYYKTALKNLKGILKYEHENPLSKKSCITNSDCPNGETCQIIEQGENTTGICSGGTRNDDASYVVMPVSSEDMSLCHNENCSR